MRFQNITRAIQSKHRNEVYLQNEDREKLKADGKCAIRLRWAHFTTLDVSPEKVDINYDRYAQFKQQSSVVR